MVISDTNAPENIEATPAHGAAFLLPKDRGLVMSIQPGYASRPTQRVWVLTKTDRCDRCGSQAYFHAILIGGNCLYFCRHHTNAYLHLLEPLIIARIDERARLFADVRDDGHFV